MTKKQTKQSASPDPTGEEKHARYINPHTDFGFKKLFGTESNIDVLKELLPVLLRKDVNIKSLQYLNPEQLGRSASDRNAVYDIYCKTDGGEKFIVEMQRSYQEFFKDRSVYYSTFPIQEQAKKGAEWDFELNGVYTVGILNFEFKDDCGGIRQFPYMHHVQLSDTETGKVFFDKLTYVYLELPKFTKTEDELETLLDKWMIVFKNLASLDERPKALQERVFERLFRIAEIEQLSKAERIAYHESQKHYWDYMNTIRSAEKKVALEKDAIIRQKDTTIRQKDAMIRQVTDEKESAIQEKEKSTKLIVGNLYGKGYPPEEIAEITGTSIEEVGKIIQSL
ncbi:MAG: Rpn family recombination-promoting nuclease/putative transposase [Tannerella sp.]|jgi:predicted transposase/invertase (TIGR01784 family)|nr:Rpn family recombination-promoting nuclease/putative transposase [Tannerella sp.]